MCGIIGFLTDKPAEQNYKLMGDLLYISSMRGTDATGIAVVNDKKIKVVKEDIPSDKFIKKHYIKLKNEITKAHTVLGHTRLATQGHQTDNNNNHPIIGEKYIMVHNGTCSSMSKIEGYPYKGTVDSEVLLSYVERKGLKGGLAELRGSAAVAIISNEEPNTVYLWRHNNPLWAAYDPDHKVIFFGSTDEILKEGLANMLNFFSSYHMRQIVEDILYKVTCNPLNIEAIEEVEPKTWSYTYNRMSGYGSSDYEGMYGYGSEEWRRSLNNNEEKGNTNALSSENDGISCKEFEEAYKALVRCGWDGEDKIFTTAPKPKSDTPLTRFYFSGPSVDFINWSRLEGGGHVSIDKKLVKFFDHTRKAHYLMTVVDAIREGLIDMNK